jgi:predicted metal-dependent phosphoesterase TrpH
MHSYYSDGTLNCKQLVNELIEKNIEFFSLTDHDTFEGYDEMLEAIKGTSLSYVPGVEFATTFEGKEYHLTTYGFDVHNKDLIELTRSNLKIRREFDIEIFKYIEKHTDYPYTVEDFLNYEDDPYLGGWPAINFFKSKNEIRDIGDFFEIIKGFDVDMTFPTPEVIISTAHKAGAKVFLAHPSSNQAGGLDRKVLNHFMKCGIDGIECYSPYSRTEEEINYYTSYCHENGLLVSGGSDYHGMFVGRQLGEPLIKAEQVTMVYFLSVAIKGDEL